MFYYRKMYGISVDHTKTFQHKEWKETTVDYFLQPAMTVMNFVAG